MLIYRGREIPCMTWRQGGDCRNYSEYRVDAPNAFLHLCAGCAERFRHDPEWTLTALAPKGETDELDAETLANDTLLLESPWVVSINGRTRADVLRERDARP